ncbi:MAG: glycosyltransferase family 39 protein [Chloroflexi bacterium]|nr:glycosyltransferase family 39 protein [Chloroflexota bacterium]
MTQSIPRPLFIILFSAFCLLLFLAFGAYQLHLPGLHYDEAKEAGLNAMQLVSGQPVTAFRDATVQLGAWRLPLMVQDYIGSLNVLLAVPFLAVGGVNVVALRWLPLVIAGLTLLLTSRIAWRLSGPVAGGVTALLLAVNPSFVFWSRQGIFVTNLTALIFMASLLTGLRWWVERKPRDLWLTAFLWGLGIYAKLLFIWAIGAVVGVGVIAWAVERWEQNAKRKTKNENAQHAVRSTQHAARSTQHAVRSTQHAACSTQHAIRHTQYAIRNTLIAALFFAIPLLPLLLFNLRTGGTLASIFGNLGRSYYGVDNTAYLPNLLTRLKQLVTLLRGDHLWYLGGVFANQWAPWLAGGLAVTALVVGVVEWVIPARRSTFDAPPFTVSPCHRVTMSPCHRVTVSLLPLALLALMVAQSAFTVSDLFITHYVLLLPLIPLAGGLAAGALVAEGRGGMGAGIRSQESGVRGQGLLPPASLLAAVALIAVLLWAGGDLWTTVRYHRGLAASGGHAGHSDAIGDLAGYLAAGGLSAPVTLDWGIDAPVRFLTTGKVNPIEVFGYAPVDAPDDGFAARVSGFLDNPDNIYLAHASEATVFQGRVEALRKLAAGRGLTLHEEIRFAERSGRPLFVIYRTGKS